MDREASRGVCFCKHEVLFSMQIDLFLVAWFHYVRRVEGSFLFKTGDTTLETGRVLNSDKDTTLIKLGGNW